MTVLWSRNVKTVLLVVLALAVPVFAQQTGGGEKPKEPRQSKKEEPKKEEKPAPRKLYDPITAAYKEGDEGEFPKPNPLAQKYDLRNLAVDMVGYSIVVLRVYPNHEAVVEIRQIMHSSDKGTHLLAARPFILTGIDTVSLKPGTPIEPKGKWRVMGTRKSKRGTLFLVFDPVDDKDSNKDSK